MGADPPMLPTAPPASQPAALNPSEIMRETWDEERLDDLCASMWADPPMLYTAPPGSQPAALNPSEMMGDSGDKEFWEDLGAFMWADPPMLSTGPPASEPAAPYPSLRESADEASDDRRQSARMQMPAEDLGRRLIHSSSDVNGEMVAPHRCRNGLIDLHHPQSFVPFDLHNLPALAFNAAATNRVLSGSALMEPRTSYRAWWLRDDKRKQSVPWTEEEHRSFLHGMQKYGSGAWGKISKEFVKTRTPSQLASHAQKFRIRQSKAAEERRRSSILDITKD